MRYRFQGTAVGTGDYGFAGGHGFYHHHAKGLWQQGGENQDIKSSHYLGSIGSVSCPCDLRCDAQGASMLLQVSHKPILTWYRISYYDGA